MPIKLYQRTSLPPSRVGAVKPPMSLADRSAEINLYQSIAGFSGEVFNKLVKSRAANEEAEFMGIVETEMEGFNTLIKSKPGLSYEEIGAERDKMMLNITAASKKQNLTGIARGNIKNWMTGNKDVIKQKAQTSMEAIRTKQEVDKFAALREVAIKNFDVPGVTKLWEGQIEAGQIEAETGRAQLEVDLMDIEVAKAKFNEGQIKEGITGVYQGIIDKGGTEDDGRKVIDQAVKERLISADTKESLYSSLSSYANKIQDSKQEKDTVTTRDFADKAQVNDLTLDDIYAEFPGDTGSDVAAREHWEKIIKKSQKPKKLPKKTTTDGMEDVMTILTDIPAGEKTTLVAIEELTDLHYIEKSISKKTLQWALARIDNPYPAHVTKQLQSTLLAVEKQVNFFWETDNERKQIRSAQDAIKQNVSEDLISWVDDELEKDRVPGSKEIYQKAAEFAVNARETERDKRVEFTGFPTLHPTVKNSDGSVSNVLLSGFSIGGREYVIPTMVDGKKLSSKEAVALAKKHGLENYPSFDTVEEGERFAQQYHDQIDENGRVIDQRATSPFEDYPDAYYENGNWYIMKDGNRYRVQE